MMVPESNASLNFCMLSLHASSFFFFIVFVILMFLFHKHFCFYRKLTGPSFLSLLPISSAALQLPFTISLYWSLIWSMLRSSSKTEYLSWLLRLNLITLFFMSVCLVSGFRIALFLSLLKCNQRRFIQVSYNATPVCVYDVNSVFYTRW